MSSYLIPSVTPLSSLIDRRSRLVQKASCWELDNILSHESLFQRLENVNTLRGHRGCVNRLAFNEEGSLLVSGSDDLRLLVWDVARNSLLHQVETGHEKNIFGVRFMPCSNDRLLASGAMDHTVRVTSLDGGNERIFDIHEGRVKTIDVEKQNPNLIFSASEDGNVKQIDLRSHEAPITIVESSKDIKSAMLNPYFPFELVVSCNVPVVYVYDRRISPSWGPKAEFCPLHMRDQGLPFSTFSCFNETGTAIAASYCYEGVYVFSTQRIMNQEPVTEQYQLKPERCREGNLRNSRRIFQYLIVAFDHFNKDQLDKTLTWITGAYSVCKWSPLLVCRWILYCLRRWPGDIYAALLDMRIFFEQTPNPPVEIPLLISASIIRSFCYKFLDIQHIHGHLKFLRSVTKEMEESVNSLVEKMEDERIKLSHELGKLEDAFPLETWWTSTGIRLSQDKQLWTKNSVCEFVQYWICIMIQRLYGSSLKLTDEIAERLQTAVERRREEERGERTLLPIHESARSAREADILDLLPSCYAQIRSLDYHRRLLGHLSVNTDIKEVNFISGKYPCVLSGSDDGCFYVWSLKNGFLLGSYAADSDAVNCVLPHPYQPLIATSGIDSDIKLWMPSVHHNNLNDIVVEKQMNRNIDKLNEILSRPQGLGGVDLFPVLLHHLMGSNDNRGGCSIL